MAGRAHRDGIQECSPQTDLAEAAFVRSGKRGHAAGWHQAGDLYFFPIDELTESRAEKALYYYQMEEKLESVSGFSNLAYLYYYGPDSIKNVEKQLLILNAQLSIKMTHGLTENWLKVTGKDTESTSTKIKPFSITRKAPT